MNMNMFNPEMMNKMKNMIDGKSMKNMLGNITNMSDDQIKMYLSASGMGHMSPQMFRQMAGQFKNMDENELERLKNNAPNVPPSGYPSYPGSNNSNAGNISTNTNTRNKTISDSNSNNNKNSTKTANDCQFNTNSTQSNNIVDKLERIKIEGNNFFRSGNYKQACEKYYEILNEMDYISDSEKNTYKKQLEDMEIVCRLNIANTKLKQDDYDLVIHECLKVLKKSENFKAHYRAGIAYFKKGTHQKAYHHLTKAKDLNKDGDVEVDRYLKECKNFVDDLEKEKQKTQMILDDKKENIIESNVTKNVDLDLNNQSHQGNLGEIRTDLEQKNPSEETFNEDDIKFKFADKLSQELNQNEPKKTSSKIEKLKEIVKKEVKTEESSTIYNKEKDDIVVEERSDNNHIINNNNIQSPSYPGFNTNIPSNMNERMSQMQRELENMDENQFEGMVGMLRSMDNATIKSMMAMQGLNMSDEQIEMMKNINPQMLQMAKKNKMNFNQENQKNTNLISNPPANTSNINTSTLLNNNTPPSFPNMGNMDFSSMLKMIQDNPQLMNMMGPQMANMFGGSGPNQQVLMNSMQNILWLISLPQRIKAFLTSTRGILFISFVIILIFAYFYR